MTTYMEKQRLFVDMDGTLATFTRVDRLETLYEKGYFLNLRPLDNVMLAVKHILNNNPDIEVYILSAFLTDSPYALDEKNRWLDKYLPEIDAAHRIFPPCGTDKKEYIPNGIRPTDCLLDDYTHNLTLWQPPARGIKVLNGINHTKGTWQHDCIRFAQIPKELAAQIVGIMQGTERTPEHPKQTPPATKMTVSQFAQNIRQQLKAANQEQSALIDLLKAKLSMPNMKAEGIVAIKIQRPDARCVKSLQEWREEGYRLKPGEFGKGIKLLTPYRQQFFQRDGVEVSVLDSTPDERQKILFGQIEVKDTVIDKMQLVFDITQTNCAPVDYNRVLQSMYEFISVPTKYTILKSTLMDQGISVKEATMPLLSMQGHYDKEKGEILINSSLKDYQQLAALCDAYGTYLFDKTGTQSAEVKAFDASYCSMMLKSYLGLPVDDAEITNAAKLYYGVPEHSVDTLNSSLTRCQRAHSYTMSEMDTRYQAIMQAQGIKLDMTRQDSVSQNFLQDLS